MSSTRPAHHADSTRTLFRNPWDAVDDSATSAQWSLPTSYRLPFEWATEHLNHPHRPVKVVKPNFSSSLIKLGCLKATWLGHASFLLELCRDSKHDVALRVLFDPIFSEKAGPSSWSGVRRRLPPPCTIEELPEFQYVVFSHNHYDHLDLASVTSILKVRGESVHFLAPLGNKSWLVSSGIPAAQISELDWWEETVLPAKSFGQNTTSCQLRFICTPAQHTSGRGLMDTRTTLWASWVVEQSLTVPGLGVQRIAAYHAGDTGYMTTQGPCPVFKEIGEKYGPFDVTMLPIWRGGTLSFVARMGLRLVEHPMLSSFHATPQQALAIHRDIRSRHSLAMHFATFCGSDIEAFDPIVELTQGREEMGIGDWQEEGGFGVIDVGETAEILAISNFPLTDDMDEDRTMSE